MNLIRKVSDWYFSRRALPYWCLLLIDCAVVALSWYAGMYVAHGGSFFASHFWPMTWGLATGLIVFIITFRFFRTYSGVVRYSSFVDLKRVSYASAVGSFGVWVVGLAIGLIFPQQDRIIYPDFPATLVLFSVSTLLLWVERVMVKLLYDSFHLDGAVPVAIYGTKMGGIGLALSLIHI